MSPFRRLLLSVPVLLICLGTAHGQGDLPCRGDCDDDGAVDDADLARAIQALFAPAEAEICPRLLGEGDPVPGANDLLAAISQRSASCEPNEAPVVESPPVYRTFAGAEIAVPIAAADPNLPLTFSAEDLPEGAAIDPSGGVFRWTPAADQASRYYVPIHVTDSGTPPLASETTLALRVSPQHACSIASCDPATGCTSSLPPLAEPCCAAGPAEPRIAEVVADCPAGAVLMIGRNVNSGFGRLQNCDPLRLIAFTQTGVSIRIHIAARCMTTGQVLILRARLETRDVLHIDREETIVMQPTGSPFSQRLNLALPVRDATMELEGQEANLSLTLRDPFTGVEVGETVRVVLRHGMLPDLPDVF